MYAAWVWEERQDRASMPAGRRWLPTLVTLQGGQRVITIVKSKTLGTAVSVSATDFGKACQNQRMKDSRLKYSLQCRFRPQMSDDASPAATERH